MTVQTRPDVASPADARAPREASLAVESGTAAALDLWNRLAAEATNFAADRVGETVKTQHQMLQCHDLTELIRLRDHWWQRTMDQYAAEATRVSDIWREALDRAVRIRTR